MKSQHTERLALQESNAFTLAGIKAFVSTAKPGIVGMAVVAALTGSYVGNHGIFPDWVLLAWAMAALALATAGACMLNNVYDRDIDRQMNRTRYRPLVTGAVSPVPVLGVGLGFIILSITLMASKVNSLSALLIAGAVFGYVVLYTLIAKRRTAWANEIGSIAGALPPVIGYAAITGGLDAKAGVLFFIMALWQQPHALSLALKYRDDYRHAGIPVLPVVKGVYLTKRKIAITTALLILITVLPYLYGMAGVIYLITALSAGLVFLYKAIKLLVSERDYDMRLFAYSLIYLVALLGSMVGNVR